MLFMAGSRPLISPARGRSEAFLAFAERSVGYEIIGAFKETGSGVKLDRAERRKVLVLVGKGHGYRLIGCEIGLGKSTVAEIVRRNQIGPALEHGNFAGTPSRWPGTIERLIRTRPVRRGACRGLTALLTQARGGWSTSAELAWRRSSEDTVLVRLHSARLVVPERRPWWRHDRIDARRASQSITNGGACPRAA